MNNEHHDHSIAITTALVERTRLFARKLIAEAQPIPDVPELEHLVIVALAAAQQHGMTGEAICGAARAVQEHWDERHPVH